MTNRRIRLPFTDEQISRFARFIAFFCIFLGAIGPRDNVARFRHETAMRDLQAIGDAVQRWEEDWKSPYPYERLGNCGKVGKIPLMNRDPWGCEYGIDGERGIVYSSGGCRCKWQKATSWLGTKAKVTTRPASIPPPYDEICEEHRIYVCYRTNP